MALRRGVVAWQKHCRGAGKRAMSIASMANDLGLSIDDDILALAPEMRGWRRELHSSPELAFEEFETAAKIAGHLESWGLEVQRGVGEAETAVVGTLRGSVEGQEVGGGRSVGLRADIDALPIQEKNVFAHASQVPGKAHLCGHDGHTSMLLGAAKLLSQRKQRGEGLPGNVHFIFQPAEEMGGGGEVMVKGGLFDAFPCDAIYGLHNWPSLEPGKIAVRSGPIMACNDDWSMTISGRGGHAAMPHTTVDPIVAAAHVVTALQSIVSRNVNPFDQAVISVATFNGGLATNVIPGSVKLSGTMRSFDEGLRLELRDRLTEVAKQVAGAYGADADVEVIPGYPVTANDVGKTLLAKEAALSVVGHDGVMENVEPTLGAEDFAYMLQKAPGCYVWLGQGKEHAPGDLHHEEYDFNDDIAVIGVAWFTEVSKRTLITTC
eukprot:g2043.t1